MRQPARPRSLVAGDGFRPLNQPGQLEVEMDAEKKPTAVRRPHWPSARRVARVQDYWRIDDEWWRETPVTRLYCELRLEGDRVITVYRDLAGGGWWLQRY